MAEVVLSIEEEVADFLRHKHPLWPQGPTACPVSSYCDDKRYYSFRDLMEHWSMIHHESDTVYKGKLCRRTYGTIKHKKSHAKSKFHHGQNVQFETVIKPNEQFIDPGDMIPYQLESPSYHSEMRKTQWSIQSVQRNKLMLRGVRGG